MDILKELPKKGLQITVRVVSSTFAKIKVMKKYFVSAAVLLAIACNSNDDKKADEQTENKTDSITKYVDTEPRRKQVVNELAPEDTTTGKGLLSGKFELVEYKKDNVHIDLPKTFVKFTRSGEFIKSDGISLFYKIEGDNYTVMASKKVKDIISTSKIEFLNTDKSSFVIKNANEKTEFTYKKVD